MIGSVYVTGVGIVSPAGCGVEANWRALAGGLRCVERAHDRSITGGGAACLGRVPGFVPPAGTEGWDRVCQLAAAAADEACSAANLPACITRPAEHRDFGGDGRTREDRAAGDGRPAEARRLFVSFGTSKGGILSLARAAQNLRTPLTNSDNLLREGLPSFESSLFQEVYTSYKRVFGGSRNYIPLVGITSDTLPALLSDAPPDAPARRLAARFGAAGTHATVAACATGSLAVIRAIQMILDGDAGVVLAGSSDASLHPLWFAAFRQMGVLADGHSQRGPAWACRPFDRSRDGFVLSEGAAALILESADSVRRRGVQPLARILGYAMGSDPAGLAQLRPDGAPLAEVIKIACARAGVDPADLAAVQAHGTGTRTNDLVEMNALRTVCGSKASQIPVVSIKGALGHLLGAAGSVEIAVSVLAAARGIVPPNATLVDADPALGPSFLPRQAVPMPAGPVLKTAMGFGGHVAAVLLDAV